MSESTRDLGLLEERLGHVFSDRALLEAALTPASALAPGVVRSAEQLELLGGAVLDLAVADLLLDARPDWDEGKLSKRRAMFVQTSSLAAKAVDFDLGPAVRLGRGEDRTGGRGKQSILAATYEAILGAIYRDGGFACARAVVARHFAAELVADDESLQQSRDWKTMLQEETQARWRVVPEYRIVAEEGPPHARRFTSEVWIAGRGYLRGTGTSKRESEQHAAHVTLERLLDGHVSED